MKKKNMHIYRQLEQVLCLQNERALFFTFFRWRKRKPMFLEHENKSNLVYPETNLHLSVPTASVYKSCTAMCSWIHLRNIYGGIIEVTYVSNWGTHHPHRRGVGTVIKRWTKIKDVTPAKCSWPQNWSSKFTES